MTSGNDRRLSAASLTIWLPLTLVLAAGFAPPQGGGPIRYRPVLDNETVSVLALDLPPRARAASYQNQHDVLWIGLNDATVNFIDGEQRSIEVQFRPGDVRFFRSFSVQQVANRGGGTFRGVMLALNSRAAGSGGACGCGSQVEQAVCGCPNAVPLPKLWAVAVRDVTIAGTALAAGDGFPSAVPRGNTVLVAVTPVELRDDQGSAQPAFIRLAAGEAHWLPAGTHRLSNIGKGNARFVTVEF